MRGNNHRFFLGDDVQLTDRTRKINQLADVLQKQKLVVRQLSNPSNQKEPSQRTPKLRKVMREDHREEDTSTNRTHIEKYQMLCNEVVAIGNRVLPSLRRQFTNEAYTQSVKKVEEMPSRKKQENVVDKQMEYLKSQDYRLYLQSITKENYDHTDVVRKMKDNRNHHVYLKQPLTEPEQTEKPESRRNNIKTLPLRIHISQHQQILNRENREILSHSPYRYDMPNHRRTGHTSIRKTNLNISRPKDESTMRLDEKSLYRELLLMHTPIQSPHRKMAHTPTMKDIHMVSGFNAKVENKKINSRTIQYMIQSTTPVRESQKQQQQSQMDRGNSIEERKQKLKINKLEIQTVTPNIKTEQREAIKEWKMDLMIPHSSHYEKSKPLKERVENNNKIKTVSAKPDTYHQQAQFKPEKNYQKSKFSPPKAKVKSKYQRQQNIRSISHSQESRQSSYEQRKENNYCIEFKIDHPYSQKAKNSEERPMQKKIKKEKPKKYPNYSDKQTQPSKMKPDQKGYHLHPALIQKMSPSLSESRATSTITRQQPHMASMSKYPVKLKVVTASKRDRQ